MESNVERIAKADAAAAVEIEEQALEGLNSGDPMEGTPEYWASKHRRLEERLKTGDRGSDI